MKAVTEQEFNEAMTALNAVPDGFKLNGSSVQSKFFVGDKEVGRTTQDGFGKVFEVNE